MYIAYLTQEEVKKFIGQYIDLEVALLTDIFLSTVFGELVRFEVKLVPRRCSAEIQITAMIDDVFENGLLRYWGWHEKFTKY